MDEGGHLIEFECPSLLCEEQEDLDNTKKADNSVAGEEEAVSKRDDEDDEDEWEQSTKERKVSKKEQMGGRQEQEKPAGGLARQEVDMDTEGENDKEHKWADKDTPPVEEKEKQKQGRGRRQSERTRNRKGYTKEVTEKAEQEGARNQMQEPPATTSTEDGSALVEPRADMINTCVDLSGSAYPGCGTGLYCPPSPVPLLHPIAQSQAPLQVAPPPPQGTKRPHSPPLSYPPPQPAPQSLEMEITRVYSTRRSIRYSTRGRGRAMALPLLSGLDMGKPVDPSLLPPAPKKKTRTLYTTDQLEHLDSLFQEDHYPDAEKRKDIAASVGVTPQRIMVWFQNRRAKWRKMERSTTGKGENKSGRSGSAYATLPARVPLQSKGTGSFTGPTASIGLPLPSIAPVYTMPPTQSLPEYSAMLASLTSPGQSGTVDGGQILPSSQGGPEEYNPPPMHSPPPLRRASLPLFTTTTLNANPTPPLLNTPVHTPPLFLETLEGSATLAHLDPSGREPQSLQGEPSSLFDCGEKLDYVTSSQQNNTLSYQLQTSYQPSQTQAQASLPRLAYLTPSPYLTPNPPESNPTSYLTFGPGAGSTGVVTYATGGHTYFQSQSAGQILVQSTGHHGGTTAYQSYPWGNMYSQPAMFQHPPSYSGSLVASRDLQQPASTSTLLPPSYFPRGAHGALHSQCPPNTQTHACTSTTTALPPVSTLRPSRLRAESSQTKAMSLVPPQVSPASPDSPSAPPCVKIEYDSPREIQSHFHCDFSPIHF